MPIFRVVRTSLFCACGFDVIDYSRTSSELGISTRDMLSSTSSLLAAAAMRVVRYGVILSLVMLRNASESPMDRGRQQNDGDRESPETITTIRLPQGRRGSTPGLIVRSGVGVILESICANFWPEHRHEHDQVVIPVGESRCRVGWRGSSPTSVERHLGSGEVWITQAGVPHWVEWIDPGEAIVIYTAASRRRTQGVDLPDAMVRFLDEYVAEEPLVAELVRLLRIYCLRRDSVSDRRIVEMASLLSVLLVETESSLARRGPLPKIGRADDVFVKVQEYLLENIDEKFSVVAMARFAGVSPRHFRRLFLRATGMTPREYLWLQRAARGKALLVAGQHNVTQAAAEAGYADQAHMNRHFRTIYGVPPSAFLPRCPA